MYRIVIKKAALKELSSLPAYIVQSITIHISNLATEPRPSGCKKLKSNENLWRIRVNDYRIIYAIDDDIRIVNVRKIGHRKDVYND